MKSRVVARSFYEDAYLGFFIRYYLDLGFDEILILKADTNINAPGIPEYALKSGLITQDELDSGRIIIKSVKNTGNDIIKTYYNNIVKKTVDWVLHVDLDEFLVIDLELYPGGINDFIESSKKRLYEAGKVPDPELVQQIKFRWLCINKMDCKFTSELESNNTDQNNTLDTRSATEPGLTLSRYVSDNNLELYSFVKSLAATKHVVSKPIINCHFFVCKNVNNIHENGKRYTPNYMYIDDLRLFVNTYRSPKPPSSDVTCRNGYILHLNTRSLGNAFTKCLVTQLRSNKQLQRPNDFRSWLNALPMSDIKNPKKHTEICDKFMSYLGSKQYFPIKIKKFNKKYSNHINTESAIAMFNRLMERMPLKTQQAMVGNIALEWQQLCTLCNTKKIPYYKIKKILNLF